MNLSLSLAFATLISCLSFVPAFGQKYLKAADKQFELQDYAGSVEGYERFLRKQPKAVGERARLAHAYRMTNRLEEAAAAYAQLESADNPDYAYRHALTLMELGKYEQAQEQLTAANSLGHPQAVDLQTKLDYAVASGEQRSVYTVSNEFANTSADEYAPVALADRVLFAADGKLVASTRDDNNFLRVPTLLHQRLDEQTNDAPVAFSPSGQLVAYTRNNFQPGERLLPEAGWELNLQLATTTDEYDFNLGKSFLFNGPGYSTGFAAFSADGTRLYFSSDRPGGQGGFDLYMSVRDVDGWGAPQNLGAEVNTSGNEVAPFAEDGALFFASDMLPGYGGMDIFRAELQGDKAVKVTNLGVGINSPRDDIGFNLGQDGDIAYFASNRDGGKGGMDIYRAVRAGTSLNIEVVNALSGEPVPNAILDFTDCGQGKYLTGVDGAFSFRMLAASSCRPLIEKPGYTSKDFTLDASKLSEGQSFKLRIVPEQRIAAYAGRIVNSRTGGALEGVRIAATQIDGDAQSLAISDADGKYELDLDPELRYKISYAVDGMADIDRELAASDDDALGTFSMFPQNFSAPSEAETSVDGVPNQGVVTASLDDRPMSKERAPVYVSPNLEPGSVDKGWAVQVAALEETVQQITKYQSQLARYGQVYGKREAGVLRVRIGPFGSKQEALALIGDVQQEGYYDAFLAREDGGAAVGLDTPAKVPTQTSTVTEPSRSSTNEATGYTPMAMAESGDYMIRLATYGNFTNFDAGSVAGIGSLTTRRRGEYVVVLLQGYSTPAEAAAQIEAARAAGFEDAHVVLETADGTLRKVK